MLSSIKKHQFIEENITITSGNKSNKDEKNPKKIPIIRQNKEKNDIIIDLSIKNTTKKEDDDHSMNSAEYSSQTLKDGNQVKYKAKTVREKPIFKTKKEYDRYTERMKERTMRLELEKINKETERFTKEYEERNSYRYLFDNNPQFQKMLKSVQKQLFFIFIIALLILILNGFIYFNFTKKKFGLSIINMALSITEIAIFLVLMISLKMGLLNDPELSKAIRIFIIIEFSLHIFLFILNIITPFLINKYIHKLSTNIKIIVYFIFVFTTLLSIFLFKFSYILFFESFLILFNKKTEYAILMIKERNNNANNLNPNLSLSHNISTIGLNQTESNLISENDKKNKTDKDDEKYRNYHYFNRFHYSVTSNREEPKFFK